MLNKAVISTDNAPSAIGTYSQAIKVSNTVYLSGQIPLDPDSMQVVEGGISAEIDQVFKNLAAVCEEAGGSLKDILLHPTQRGRPLVSRNCPKGLAWKWTVLWSSEKPPTPAIRISAQRSLP